MTFQTGLSGLNASSKSLDVIGNNIANAGVVGMKSSRAEFADIVASSLGAADGKNNAGIGVAVATISQNFSQGNINITGNGLDVAINGGGFFAVETADKTPAFTRDGQFKLDKNGFLITNAGANVLGYPTDLNGIATSIIPEKLVLPTGAPIPAKATTAIGAEFNLDTRVKVATSTVPPTPISSYGTSLTGYDSQGAEVPMNLYFVKVGPDANAQPPIAADTWNVFDSTTVAAGKAALTANATAYATDTANTTWNTANPGPDQRATFAAAGTGVYAADPQLTVSPSGELFQMTFDNNGKLLSPLTPPSMMLTSPNPSIGNFTVTLDVSKATQYGTAFSVSNLTQDGYTSGELTGVAISATGVIKTTYSNGQTQANGKIALADFRNVQGLAPIGGGNYVATFTSGPAVVGSAGVGKYGEMRAGAVEESNIDLTAELVNMMTAQRAYQANAQTIKTQDQVLSTLTNLR